MKKNKYIIIGAFLLTAATANAGDLFGAVERNEHKGD